MSFAKHKTFRSYIGSWRHKIRNFAVRIFQNVKKNLLQFCAKYFV